jgi:hypothetical protein
MHIGQGAELAWTFYLKSPTELEYIEMIDNSKKNCMRARNWPANRFCSFIETGGLFRLLGGLMHSQCSTAT